MDLNATKKVWKRCDSIPIHIYRQFLATITSSFLTMCGGLTYGISAVLLPKLMNDETLIYDRSYDSWIASIASLSMIFSCIGIGGIIDRFGRKLGQIILNIPFIVGWLFIYLAQDVNLIIVGRFITGISTGSILATILAYIGEITDPKIRSIALLLPTLMTYVGILISHIAGGYLEWRNSILACLVPSLCVFVMCFFLKESPFWLISNGRLDEGVNLYRWFRGESDDAEKELTSFLQKQNNTTKTDFKEFWKIVLSRSFLKVFVVLVVLMLCLQSTGLILISFYALEVFEKTFCGHVDAFMLMIVCDCTRLIATLTLWTFAGKMSKRISFLTCSFGVVATLIIIIISMSFLSEAYVWVSVTSFILYIGFSSAATNIGWTFLPELMPNNVRGSGSGMITCFFFILLFIGVKMLPSLWTAYGLSAMYSCLGVLTLSFTIILCFILPETHGKTLQAIEDDFANETNAHECSRL